MFVCVCVRDKIRFWLPFGQTPSPYYPNSRQYTTLSKNCLKVCSTLVALEITLKQLVMLIPVHEVFVSGGPAGSPPLYVSEYLDCTICAPCASLGTHRGQERAPDLELELTDGC